MKEYKKLMLKLCYPVNDSFDLNKRSQNNRSLYFIYFFEKTILDFQENIDALDWVLYP